VEKPFKVTNCDLEKTEDAKQQIFVARGRRVMLDHHLARLYGVTTKRLNEQLRRNRDRFPTDFAFQLTLVEAKELAASRSQNATLNRGHNIKHAPHVFTEHGAIMLASVSEQQDRGSSQHLRRTRVRADARCTAGVRRSVPQNRCSGFHIRSPFPARLHRDSGPDGTA
jgi:hypothetical protein